MSIIGLAYRINNIFVKMKYKCLFGKRLSYSKFGFRKRFNVFIEKTGHITIGERCFFNNDCSLNCHNEITIGSNCVFGENVKMYDHNHKFRDKDVRIADQGFSSAPITIGNNCWIGTNVVILKGVNIGNHVVIGAGCVIDRDIEDDSIVICASREITIKKMEK